MNTTKTGGEIVHFGRESISCSTCCTRHVTHVTNARIVYNYYLSALIYRNRSTLHIRIIDYFIFGPLELVL
jgi:hypothetical protein